MRNGALSEQAEPQTHASGGESPPRISSDLWLGAVALEGLATGPFDDDDRDLALPNWTVIADGRSRDDDEDEEYDDFDDEEEDLDEYEDDDLYEDDLDEEEEEGDDD